MERNISIMFLYLVSQVVAIGSQTGIVMENADLQAKVIFYVNNLESQHFGNLSAYKVGMKAGRRKWKCEKTPVYMLTIFVIRLQLVFYSIRYKGQK